MDSCKKWKRIWLAGVAGCLALLSLSTGAFAANKYLLLGIQNYQDGDFAAAAGNLGAAMPTEFNSPTLHYYMGNCCVHLKQMETAVREFRIAYALDPTGPVGRFAKQALDYLDVDAQGQGLTRRAAPSAQPRLDPQMERALATLDKQAGVGRSYYPQQNSQLPWWMQQRKGNDVPPELSRYLDGLRQQYEANNGSGNSKGGRPTTEMQKSAENLKNLLKEKTPEGKHHLSPIGTNLYTRNYSQGDQKNPNAAKPQAGAVKPPVSNPDVSPGSEPAKTPGAIPGKDGSLFQWK